MHTVLFLRWTHILKICFSVLNLQKTVYVVPLAHIYRASAEPCSVLAIIESVSRWVGLELGPQQLGWGWELSIQMSRIIVESLGFPRLRNSHQ